MVFRIRYNFHSLLILLLFPVGKRREVLQRAHLLFLPAPHVGLLVGGNLVALYARAPRIGQFGVETGFPGLFLPVLFRRGENPPHAADEQQEHSGINRIFPDFLPLFQFVRIVTHCLVC